MGFKTLKKVVTSKSITYFELYPSSTGEKYVRIKESHYKKVVENLESFSHTWSYEDNKTTLITVFLTK